MDAAPLSDAFHVLDLTGVLTSAVLGGGLIRDTLLQHGPPIALTDYRYLVTALVGALIAYVVRIEGHWWNRLWPVVDALALGAWSAAGAQRTLSFGLGWLSAILLGTITAVGGAMVRDVVLRRIPGILGGNTLYATSAVVASAVLVVADLNGHPTAGLVLATVVGAGLVLAARRRGWMLPEAEADAWSPARVVPARYRRRLRSARRAADRERDR